MAGEVKKLQFSEGTDVGAPTDLSLATSTNHLKTFANDSAYLADKGASVTEGDIYINTTVGTIRYYEGGAWKDTILAYDPSDPTKLWTTDLSTATAGTSTTLKFKQTANRIIDAPDATGEILLSDNTKDVTNKDLIAESTVFKSNTGTNRKAKVSTSGATNTTQTTVAFAQTADRVVTMPDATDTLVGKATTDVLTNKDIDGGTAANNRRITIPKNTTTNLDSLTRKEATLLFDTDLKVVKYDDGTSLATLSTTSAATPSSAGVVTSFVPIAKSAVKVVSNANLTILDTDGYGIFLITTGASDRTITLPVAANNPGRQFLIKKVDSGAGTVIISGSIDGAASYTLTQQYAVLNLVCDGTSYSVLATGRDLLSSQVIVSTNAGATNQYFDMTSISLTPGAWDIEAMVTWFRNGSTYTAPDFVFGVSATSGNSSAGLTVGVNATEENPNFSNTWNYVSQYFVGGRVQTTSNTTRYLKGYPGMYSAGTPQYTCILVAKRAG